MDKNDWDINPQNYLQNEDGSFKLKADGTPKKNRVDLKALKVEDITITQRLKQNKRLQKSKSKKKR